MKKILLPLLALFLYVGGKAQFVENFNYTVVNAAADSLDNAAFKAANPTLPWVLYSTIPKNLYMINRSTSPYFVNTGIKYAGYNSGKSYTDATGAVELKFGGGTGNTRKSFIAPIGTQDSVGTFYTFMTLCVSRADTVYGDFFFTLSNYRDTLLGSPPSSNQVVTPCKISIRKGTAAGKFQLAISKNSVYISGGTYARIYSGDYNVGDTLLLVVKYVQVPTVATGSIKGVANDQVYMHIFNTPSVNLPSVEPAVPTLYANDNADSTSKDFDYKKPADCSSCTTVPITPAGFGGMCLRQGTSGGASANPYIYTILKVDGLKVAKAWNDVVLPCRLQNFTAVPVNGQVNVNWEMCNEQNVKGYSLEKSTNGTSFTTVDIFAAKGLANINKYTSFDKNAGTGSVYYRVKTIYNNGDIVYSNVAKVNLAAAIKVQVSPNPAKNFITVNASTAIKTVEVFNVKGALVLKVLPNAVGANLDISNLSVGSYVVKTTTAEGSTVNTIIKQ